MSAGAGTLVADRFRLGRVLGVGGMGVVYEAEQLPLRRTVAVKMLPREGVGSEHAVQRLIEEARALSRIDHPGVVRVIDAGRGGHGQAFLVMEYLEGRTLKQLLSVHGPLPWRWVSQAMRQCLAALEVVHEAGLIHRDIKPSNCFCCGPQAELDAPIGERPPLLKLIDFGVARAERARRAGAASPAEGGSHEAPLLGTPAYWAPEQARSGQSSRRSDLYSVGATLYELLTGALPRRLACGIEAPSAVNPGLGIPPDLDAIVLKALSAEPGERFESAAALGAALLAVEEDRSQGATWPGPPAAPRLRAPPRGLDATAGTATGEEIQLLRLRAKVREFWIEGVLRSSLVPSLPTPPRTLEPGLIAGLGEALQAPPPLEVPPARSTTELFERHGRSLLIVGPAGSGKTTQLLLVARELLEASGAAVPVVLTLSAWGGGYAELCDWLRSELRSKYQVPSALSASWLRRRLILPLLDGLDEVRPRHRGSAIDAINRCIEAGGLPGLLVTSRTKEYADVGTRLGLSGAVRLHPLPAVAVDELCSSLATAARLAPEQWQTLRPLLDSPLALSLVSSSMGRGVRALATSATPLRLEDLLEVYIEHMIQRTGKGRLPCEPEELLQFLAELAHALNCNGTDIFVPDGVQPSWLAGAGLRRAYALVSRLAAASVYGASLILSFGFTPLDNAGLRAGLGFGLSLALSTALCTGAVHGAYAARRLLSDAQRPVSARRHWLQTAGLGALSGALNAMVMGLWSRHPMAAVLAAEVALLAAPLLSPHPDVGTPRGDIHLIDRVRFSFTRALRSSIFGLVAGFIAAGVVAEDATAMIFVMSYLTSLWFLFGGLRGRQVATGARPYIYVVHSLQWSITLGALAIPLTAIPTALAYGGRYGVYAGLTTGAVIWLWYGGMGLLQYAVLRLLLRWSGARLFRTSHLEAAADRALLHRLGSGYLFVHPLLRANIARRRRPSSAR